MITFSWLLIIKIFFSCLELTAGTMLSLSLFRIPLKNNYFKIFIIGFTLGLIGFYIREVLHITEYALITNLAVNIVLLVILFRINILYSLLISIIGFLSATLIELFVVLIGVTLKITTINILQDNQVHLSILFSCSALIMIIITIILQYYKLGFMFTSTRFTINHGYNFILSAVLLVSVLVIQLVGYKLRLDNTLTYLVILLAIALLLGLYFSYRQNKKILHKKYVRSINK